MIPGLGCDLVESYHSTSAENGVVLQSTRIERIERSEMSCTSSSPNSVSSEAKSIFPTKEKEMLFFQKYFKSITIILEMPRTAIF